ncbi:TRAF3-interacting protein 1 isoform X6 [Heterocephalus glaber]|uniref:TRAF3-interacting protein 1 n=1 Tax=Heterocephalus glaber TaxID=10181 RepID=A0AAX6S2M9_HETGA|nr:TRAF3-interacting protein 1 isoform X6 [Heterocephalus glaber]
MNAAVVRRTQEALGKVIRRPPLTEKLLSKPPFRYLHDIITEVIRMTGFLKGLYTDSEMKSDNVKDKDAKISFLQKAIDVVVMVSGEPLLAKPARIVAGHEPERTNELLQMIGKCCLNKLSSDEAVKRVLAGEKGDARGRAVRTSKSHELDNKNTREEESRTRKGKEDRRNSEVKEKSTSRGEKQKEEPKEESKPRDRERDKEKMKESDGDRHRDPERDKLREGERERARNRAKQDRERDKGRGNKDQDKELDREEEGGRRSEGRKEQERLQGLDQERDLDRGGDREHVGARGAAHTHRPPSRAPDREKSGEQDRPGKKSASSGEMPKKPSDEAVKDSKAEAEVEISSRVSRSLASKTSKWRPKNSVEGGLVKKILETKKDYEKLQQASRPGEKEKSLVFESAWKKEKDIVCKEIEKLRGSIQTLCKSALPLGKIMDYLQEDVDAMRHELQLWHSENRQHVEALQREQSITDCAVEPLKAELAELEQQVKDQQDKICAVKANILRNEEKIQKMVYSINLTSRR